jgi:hypothetical protein
MATNNSVLAPIQLELGEYADKFLLSVVVPLYQILNSRNTNIFVHQLLDKLLEASVEATHFALNKALLEHVALTVVLRSWKENLQVEI